MRVVVVEFRPAGPWRRPWGFFVRDKGRRPVDYEKDRLTSLTLIAPLKRVRSNPVAYKTSEKNIAGAGLHPAITRRITIRRNTFLLSRIS